MSIILAAQDAALKDLNDLTDRGIRFHGTAGLESASHWLEEQLRAAGLAVTRQRVAVPGWAPGEVCRLRLTSPEEREIRAWPLLWSGSTGGARRGRVVEMGPEGLWGDSMVWQKFLVLDEEGEILAYLIGRDSGRAAPQPLPSGSDYARAHFAIGREDADALARSLAAGEEVSVELELDCVHGGVAASDNLIVDIPAAPDAAGEAWPEDRHVLLCAHYDTFWNTPGAYDNGSGTIALLRLARTWAHHAPPRPVRLIFFTGEEWHLSGSREYLAQTSQHQRDAIAYVLNIDGLGRGEFVEAFAAPERFEVEFSLTTRAYAAATRPGLRVVSRFPPTTGTDDATFYRAGIPSGFMTLNDREHLHQPEDLPNPEIAQNIIWVEGLAAHLLETLAAPARAAAPGIL
ncbi:M20/M25/M40 family metallo-hydrolase [Mycetocola spongiae]|uniref:M20/M25/M40 family metallo-hydrolase n=1 Tax=Mycetocola spongiae TaxID=2859226 RepID=UPI001CF53006|nr:M20/M25/M40 family metallo-hydrolase [Mycetocola spongiae]UCR89182.1 Zn-dependent exopeptidase M28 [Mycetocola spongiae]